MCKRVCLIFLAVVLSSSVWAQKKKKKAPAAKKVLSSKEYDEKAKVRMKGFQMPKGLKAELWADESQTTNPSAICFDSKGRMYVAEIHRWRFGVDDIRNRRYMLFEDLMIESSEDRLAMFNNHLNKHPMKWYTDKVDTIKLLEDKDGDGRADYAKTYADGFNAPLDGPGIGVIERDNKIYYTNIPHLWMMEDTDGDGVADKKKSLQDGFGIRMSFSGHDMHGLIWGPDGKLYWSIGDRGYSITTKEGKKFHGPNEGAVFRCDPDGSNVELFYDRLRNPQELQFDDYGNLFTADNDGDKSDLERINYLVEGGDSGWNAGHQALMSFTRDYNFRSYKYTQQTLYNSWETDKMWKVRSPEQPQYILPGIGQINGGPSGFLFNPGNSMGKEYDDKFFVIHYKGSIARSSVSMFDIEDDGAGFKTANHKQFFKGSNCVDIEFGPDGKMYMSDYNYGGWTNQNVGNIYTFSFPEQIAKPEILENKKYLTSDFSKLSTVDLSKLLSRDHLTIRQKAQFELAKRGAEGEKVFKAVMSGKSNSTFARIHGVWGIGQMAYKNSAVIKEVLPFINDENDQVRIQVARVLGDHRVKDAAPALVKALTDKHARTAMYAAIGLGRIGYDASAEVVEAIRKNADKDLFLRHGLIMALHGLDKSKYLKYAKDSSPSVRLAVLLALRKKKDAQIAIFLNDTDQTVRYEAIRAINDRPIIAATSELAKQLDRYTGDFEAPKSSVDQFIHHRIINANFNSGKMEDAARLLKYAANTKVSEKQKLEALAAIEGWNDDYPLDSTTGLPRTQIPRIDIKATVVTGLDAVFKTAQGKVLAQATRIAVLYGYNLKPEVLMAQLKNPKTNIAVRNEALASLISKGHPDLSGVVKGLLKDKDQGLRSKAHVALVKIDPAAGVKANLALLKKGTVKDKQNAWKVLGTVKNDEVKKVFDSELSNIMSGKGEGATKLDVIEAAKLSPVSEVKAKVAAYEKSIPAGNMMAKFMPAMLGGDVSRGKDVFMTHGAAQCVRCHKINGVGADVGPDLSAIGKEKDSKYLLESIVAPAATVAKGFGMVTVTMKDGKGIQGILSKETKDAITIKSIDGKTSKEYSRSGIKSMTPPISGMPPMHLLLKPFEIRDIVAYLGSLKKAKKGKSDSH